MGDHRFLNLLDPDQLREMAKRFPDILSRIPGGAEFISSMEEAKVKAESSFRRRELSENWDEPWDADLLKTLERFGEFGTPYPWHPAACDYIWELGAAYLRSPACDCEPDRFEAMAALVIDLYSERVYEEKLRRHEEKVWLTYEHSKAEFKKYAVQRLDPLVRSESLRRWEQSQATVPPNTVNGWSSTGTAPPDSIAEGGRRQSTQPSSAQRSALAAKRRAVVAPILEQKGWSRWRWATGAGVGKNCIYEYLDGSRDPTEENRQAMADELGLTLEQLPD